MSVRAPPARTEELAPTTSTATLVHANQASQAFSVRPTYQTALKAPVLMEAPALMGSRGSNVPAGQDSLEITASTR